MDNKIEIFKRTFSKRRQRTRKLLKTTKQFSAVTNG